MSRHSKKINEPGLPTSSVCPLEGNNIMLGSQCLQPEKKLLSYTDAVSSCSSIIGTVAAPMGEIQNTILRFTD